MCTSCQITNVYWCISIPTNALGRSIPRNVHIFLSKCVLMRFNSNKCTRPICHEIFSIVQKSGLLVGSLFVENSYVSSPCEYKIVSSSSSKSYYCLNSLTPSQIWGLSGSGKDHTYLISHHLASLKLWVQVVRSSIIA